MYNLIKMVDRKRLESKTFQTIEEAVAAANEAESVRVIYRIEKVDDDGTVVDTYTQALTLDLVPAARRQFLEWLRQPGVYGDRYVDEDNCMATLLEDAEESFENLADPCFEVGHNEANSRQPEIYRLDPEDVVVVRRDWGF